MLKRGRHVWQVFICCVVVLLVEVMVYKHE